MNSLMYLLEIYNLNIVYIFSFFSQIHTDEDEEELTHIDEAEQLTHIDETELLTHIDETEQRTHIDETEQQPHQRTSKRKRSEHSLLIA